MPTENRPEILPLGPPNPRVEVAQGGAWASWRRGKRVAEWCCHLFSTSDACPHTRDACITTRVIPPEYKRRNYGEDKKRRKKQASIIPHHGTNEAWSPAVGS